MLSMLSKAGDQKTKSTRVFHAFTILPRYVLTGHAERNTVHI
jgi:hypothetical protein